MKLTPLVFAATIIWLGVFSVAFAQNVEIIPVGVAVTNGSSGQFYNGTDGDLTGTPVPLGSPFTYTTASPVTFQLAATAATMIGNFTTYTSLALLFTINDTTTNQVLLSIAVGGNNIYDQNGFSTNYPATFTVGTLPAGTYQVYVSMQANIGANQTLASEIPLLNVSTDIVVIGNSSSDPQVEAAIAAAASAAAAGQTDLANQIAGLANQLATDETNITALQNTPQNTGTGNLSGLTSDVTSLQSQLSDLQTQVGNKANQPSLLMQYGVPIGAGAALGVGGSFLIDHLIDPPRSPSPGASATPETGTRPGYYER